MLDENEGGEFDLIVFGFFGSRFSAASGNFNARPVGPIADGAQMRQLRVSLWRDDEKSTIETVMPVARFLEKFPPTPVSTATGRAHGADERSGEAGSDTVSGKDYKLIWACLKLTYWANDRVS